MENSFPMPQKAETTVTKTNVVEAPSPSPSKKGRPVFSFSFGSRKNFPSKWDNAEKWLINGHDSPAYGLIKSTTNFSPKQQQEATHEKTFSVFQGPKIVSLDHDDVLLKVADKFKEMEAKTKTRDTWTEMTPVGGSTPVKSRSPPRHNTPATTKVGLTDDEGSSLVDINGELNEWHLAKLHEPSSRTLLDVITSKWSSREEEEEVSKSHLRYVEMKDDDEYNTSTVETISGPRPSAWEEKENSEYCIIRYQMEEAKIQAWVNLQKAKAEAESRKLEVKIQKMRSKYEEKLMKKMMIVDRKAEELRAAAQLQHSEQIQKMSTNCKSNNSINLLDQSGHFSGHRGGSCVCFIRNSS